MANKDHRANQLEMFSKLEKFSTQYLDGTFREKNKRLRNEYSKHSNVLEEAFQHKHKAQTQGCIECGTVCRGWNLEVVWKEYEEAFMAYVSHMTNIDSFKRSSEDLELLGMLQVFMKHRNMMGKETQPTTPADETVHGVFDFVARLKILCESDPVTFSAGPALNIKLALEKVDQRISITSRGSDLFQLIEVLMHADKQLDEVEREVCHLILAQPELSLEIMMIKVQFSKMVAEKWKFSSGLLSKQLVQKSNYERFKIALCSLLKVGEPDRNLIQLKRLVQKPQLDLVRSHEEFWNVLDFLYRGPELGSTRKVHHRSSSRGNTFMITLLRPQTKPPISTSAVELFQLKSFREQRASLPCVRSCKAPECNHNVLVFDGMIVEEDATPMGVGMEDYDTIGIIPRYDIRNVEETDEIVESFGGLGLLQTIICETQRKNRQVHVGLNVVVGAKEGGLPLLKNQDLKHREELANLKTALLPALQLTMEGSSSAHLPDFSSVREKLEAGVYTRASQGLKEVESILDRYGRLAKMASKANGTSKEGKARLQLHKSLVQTMSEFHWAINGEIVTYIDAKQEAARAFVPPEPDSGPLVYLGPVRNATPNNFLASLPIVQFQGVSKENTVEQLIDAWCHYTKEQSKDLEKPEFVMYNNKRCNTSVCIKDLDMVLEGLYFSLPLGYNALVEDEKDLEQLLEFIEGDDDNDKKEQGAKKKKKRKKKSGVEEDPCGEKSKTSSKATDKVVYDLVIRNVPDGSNILKELEDLYSAHGTVGSIRPMDPTGHCWSFIATVTFKNKAALHRSAKAMKLDGAHLAPHHRLVVREALQPFLEAWKESKGERAKYLSDLRSRDYLTEEEQTQLYWNLHNWGKATCDILVRNIPPNCSIQDLLDVFLVYGDVRYVQIIRHRGWPKVATVTFTSGDAILAALKAGRSKPFMLRDHELIVENGNKTDIAYANYMADCQLVVEEKRVLDASKRSTKAAKMSLEAQNKSPEADINKSLDERNLGIPVKEIISVKYADGLLPGHNSPDHDQAPEEVLGASCITCPASQVDTTDQLTDGRDKEEPSLSRESGLKKVSPKDGASGQDVMGNSSKYVVSNDKRTQIEEKEARLQETRDYLKYVRDIKGKKMADLINSIDAVEDQKAKDLKQISVVEMKISDLQADLERLVKEVKESDDQIINLARDKKDFEMEIDNNIQVAKKEMELIEEEINALKVGFSPDSSRGSKRDKSETKISTNPNMQLLEYIENKIEAKEKELECPVCLEVALAPIFMCSDLHLICSDCRPKVTSHPYQYSNIKF